MQVASCTFQRHANDSPQTLRDGTFHFYHTKNDINVFKTSTQVSGEPSIVRGEGVCENLKAHDFMKVYLGVNTEMDPTVKRNDIVHEWSDDEGHWKLNYFVMGIGPMVADRDFIRVYRIIENPEQNELVYTSTSVDQDSCPETNIHSFLPSNFKFHSGAVRGNDMFTTLRLSQCANGDLRMSYAHQSNPNGWVPLSIVNAAILTVPQALCKTAKALRATLKHLRVDDEL
ncbi:hypothetical protein C9374_004124 [Naegleria lovaniensis]|uniref:START domain-containing protein n=1 Tax=Naegleria lovaniensis TaxID=51637 RepID=A0AA88GS44_NAELO|nr:uncharacterized protein C9374_004124 [Naegleria lovaniensis]KAG2383453.1 hypothetical protein C9374_004124 [Naegleria lovaniensis]